MRHRRGRRGGFPLLAVLPLAGGWSAWGYEGTPGGGYAMLAITAAGLLAGITAPALLLAIAQLPKALVPARLLAWHRRDREDRPHIPDRLRRAVYAADGWKCRHCRATGTLQLDHVRPWSTGGLTTFWNLVTLCAYCNRVKSNYWTENGRVIYRAFAGANHPEIAAAILAREKRARWSPVRWARASMSLGYSA